MSDAKLPKLVNRPTEIALIVEAVADVLARLLNYPTPENRSDIMILRNDPAVADMIDSVFEGVEMAYMFGLSAATQELLQLQAFTRGKRVCDNCGKTASPGAACANCGVTDPDAPYAKA